MLIPLTSGLLATMEEVAHCAQARHTPIGVEDLIIGLQSTPIWGPRLAQALRPTLEWGTPTKAPLPTELAIWVPTQPVFFDTESQRLFLEGAHRVILGSYEPHHLAEAIGKAAELHPERFTRFGLRPQEWRRVLQERSADP